MVYMVLGDAVSTLKTFVWILNHVSRSIKASNLVKSLYPQPDLWYQFIVWLKFETRPVRLRNFGMVLSLRPRQLSREKNLAIII